MLNTSSNPQAGSDTIPPAPEQGIFLPPYDNSAQTVVNRGQVIRAGFILTTFVLFTLWDYKIAFTVLNCAICGFYAASVGFRLMSAGLACLRKAEIHVTGLEVAALSDVNLPVYTVLVPLYHEAGIVAKVGEAINSLDYPHDKLDVKILLEEEDAETRKACEDATLPDCCEILSVPDGSPRTKPRACNFGLNHAKGDLLVIFDAEDRPEPDQLKKSVAAFQQVSQKTVCLQAKLNYYNPDYNWITRFFTLEYTAWFDLFLPGLHRMGLPIPLGGTSNHFRAEVLKEIGGWDPYNVAEDCDLGIRLARRGYCTQVLESTTWEEANSRLWNWIRQRSRWVKGYIQTHLVHMRHPLRAVRELGLRGFIGFLLSVGGLAGVLLLNPFYWLVLTAWLYLRWKLIYFDYTDATEQHYTFWSQMSWAFFALALLLFAANFALIGMNVLACRRRDLWKLLPYAFLSPFYWILISLAAWKGALQLLWKPHYWEKTKHGLDL